MLSYIPLSVQAAKNTVQSPAIISIIIDDIGYRLKEGRAMIKLSPELTYAILPNAPHTKQLAALAHQNGKEVMLHLPMQATSNDKPEQDALSVDMSQRKVVEAMQKAFANVPQAVGMNNHQGSLLTRHPGHMAWVMAEMKKNGRYFVDSRTSKQSVAEQLAIEKGVPSLNRDVFLDHDVNKVSIEAQFNRLITLAKQNGHAVGIGHPHPETLVVLQEMLPKLEGLNVRLVPVSNQLKNNRTYTYQTKALTVNRQE
jgi:polysaccharide deacetylase 2 family uncharacterized protein YibQ